MNQIMSTVGGIWAWIQEDYRSYPLRFAAEFVAWVVSVAVAITMAVTLPNPPFYWIYPAFIVTCSLLAWAAYTRKSFGMLANYVLMITIDTVGLTRLLWF